MVLSVPYLLSGTRHSQRCFELAERVSSCRPDFWLALLWLDSLATFAGMLALFPLLVSLSMCHDVDSLSGFR